MIESGLHKSYNVKFTIYTIKILFKRLNMSSLQIFHFLPPRVDFNIKITVSYYSKY